MLHALASHGAGIFNLAVGRRFDDAAWAELLLELRIFRVVVGFRFFFRVQVIEVTEELVEAVLGRQVLVLIAQMVFAELSRHVTLLFEQITDGGGPIRNAVGGSGHADGQQTGTEWLFTGNEGCAAGSAGLLTVVIGKEGPFIGDPVQVRGLVAHHPLVVGTDVPVADVIAHDGKNIGLGGCCGTTSGGH